MDNTKSIKSIVTCKITLDHAKLTCLAKEHDVSLVWTTSKEVHDALVEGFKETVLYEVDDDLDVITVEFTDELIE